MATKEQVIDTLKKVMDPELGIDVWTLGLIYEVDVGTEQTNIKMTFTSPMCPYGPMLLDDIKSGLQELGIEKVDIKVVFDPVWEPSDEVKEMLGLGI